MSAPAAQPPPHSTVAEVQVLGGLLQHPEAVDLIADRLIAEDLYHDQHRVIYRGILEMAKAGAAVDSVSLGEHLRLGGRLDEAGGVAYLLKLCDAVPTAAQIETHALQVSRLARRREALSAAMEIQYRFRQTTDDDDADLDWAEQRMFQACRSRDLTRNVRRAKDVARATHEDMERLSKIEGIVTGLSTGHRELDEMTTGLQRGDLVVLAGRPAMGKTSEGLQIAWKAAQGEEGVLFCSIEMRAESLMRRLLALEADIPGSSIRLPSRLTPGEWGKIVEAEKRISKSHLVFDDSATISTFDIRMRARRLKAKQGLALVVVDYLQIMKAIKEADQDNRERLVAGMTRDLKAIAKDLEVPVLCLSQLNRGPEHRANRRPNLGDLRESGAIEQDADLVLFLYRGAVYYPQSPTVPTNGAELIIGKNRNGPTGIVKLLFHEERTCFEDWDEIQAIYPKGRTQSSQPRPKWIGGPHPAEPPERDDEDMPF